MGDVEAALDERDPEFIRRRLADTWPLVRRWFRAEVRGLDLIPDGPALVVGNHSGGNLTPDSVILALAYNEYTGAERPSYALTDDIGPTSTRSSFFRKFGAISPSPQHAKAAFDRDGVVLVYPGNNEVHRPSWQRHRIDLGGRLGWARLARDHNVPVVPAVAIGGQETALFLTRGETLARALRLDRLFGVRELPLSIALPWGLNVGDFFGHIPLPSKIVIQLLPPMTVGDDLDAAYHEITGRMQDTLTGLAAHRRFPVIG